MGYGPESDFSPSDAAGSSCSSLQRSSKIYSSTAVGYAVYFLLFLGLSQLDA